MAQDIADDLCENWEDMIENGILEKKIEKLQMKTPKISSSSSEESNEIMPIPQLKLEDNSRTQYIPQVKILKRPNDAKLTGVMSDKSPLRQTVKTLKQREAEYAEARLRILGSAQDEEQNNSVVVPVSLAVSERKNESEVVVKRLPRGPDETQGFLLQR